LRIATVAFLAILAVGLSMGADSDPLTLSLSLQSNRVKLDERVTIFVTFSNNSGVPRYLHGELLRNLEFSVNGSDGKLIRGLGCGPPPPPEPAGPMDFIWLDKHSSIRLALRLPLKDLWIDQAGVYRIAAFADGLVATESQLDSRKWYTVFLNSEPVEISVPNKAVPLANPPLNAPAAKAAAAR
jgi:hypothetical protein